MSDDPDWIDELYAESAEEPPAALDETILAAARDNAKRPWYRNLRYLTTIATAASFVLAAMVVYYAPEDSFTSPASAPAPELREAADQVPSTDRQSEADQPSTIIEPPRAANPAVAGSVESASDVRETRSLSAKREQLGNAVREEATAHAPVPEPPSGATSGAARELQTTDTAKQAQQPPFRLAGSLSAEDKALPTETLATLIDVCGPAPGSETSRRLARDAIGWYLAVTSAASVTYYRCENDAWRNIDGPVTDTADSEQQPDPDDDQ